MHWKTLLHQNDKFNSFVLGVAQWWDRRSKLTSAHVTSEVVGSIPGQTHSSCDREGDSLWQRKFPPGSPVSSSITLVRLQIFFFFFLIINFIIQIQIQIGKGRSRSIAGPITNRLMIVHRANNVQYSICLVLSHMFGYLEQKLPGRSRKSLVFLKSICLGSEKFRHKFCRNKKICSVKSRFPVHLPQYNLFTILALYRLFLGRFQWNFHDIICLCPVSLKNIQK
jgi:hypothetical protein